MNQPLFIFIAAPPSQSHTTNTLLVASKKYPSNEAVVPSKEHVTEERSSKAGLHVTVTVKIGSLKHPTNPTQRAKVSSDVRFIWNCSFFVRAHPT